MAVRIFVPGDMAAVAAGLFAGAAGHDACIGRPEDLAVFKRRARLTFARCGIIDPASIDAYRAHGGWRGLEAALRLGPEAMIEAVKLSGLRGHGGAPAPPWLNWPMRAR